ncbi:6-chlorohydroxyquinol-1,2-dioxygenase [Bradyrhizobium macuxiense]|uniref:6-chlorohydroxyquinol-1,2-dioxygenase n=1 Tax=Bradyrhizobium macuxiense TaxID=1755647 RepID=A0A125Q6N0_9BRAD|nr:intradiol ring-cleavage dioxygenase [Bradyrhizobium macuxiense]KWV48427.1 6-chlorohydroxyquinol-1,2-dioxygenase [Bradyrhizobium macuxiense]
MEDHEKGYFTEKDSEEVVIGRNKNAKDERLKEVMAIVIRKLHEAVKEIEPTQQEWFEAIMFLTRTGQMCTDWRQEFILLSDTLGVSMLVDAINHRKPVGASESTVLGPFYVQDAPELKAGTNICLDHKGEDMVISGFVRDTTGRPIPNVKLDVWQTNDDGFYDVQQKGLQPDFNLRGVFRTDEAGRYWFRAVKPRFYPIPDDGPVGQLLGKLGRHPFRPAHLHFIISADGFQTLTTHIFDSTDQYIDSDAVFGVKKSLLANIERVTDLVRSKELEFANPFWETKFDFVLAPESEAASSERTERGKVIAGAQR